MENQKQKWLDEVMSILLNLKPFQIAAQEAKNMPVHSAEWRGRSIPKKEGVRSFFGFRVFEDSEAAI